MPPRQDLLSRLDRGSAKLENALNLVAAIAIVGVMFFGVAQILSRVLSNLAHDLIPAIPPIAIYGYIDYVQFVAVLYAFLGIAYCQRQGGHIRMEIVLANLRGRVQWAVETLAVLLGIVVTVLLIYGTWDNFHNAWARGDSSMDINLPLWPAKLVVPLMLVVLLWRLLLQLWGYARLLRQPSATPIGVPLVEDAKKAAQREIDEALARLDAEAAARQDDKA